MSTSSSIPCSIPHRHLNIGARIPSVREQAEAAGMSTMTPCNSIDEIPRLTINNRDSFILEGLLHSKHDRARYSYIWEHGTAVIDITKGRKVYWLCNICDEHYKTVLFDASTTSNSKKHLRVSHRIQKPGDSPYSSDYERQTPSFSTQPSIETAFSRAKKRKRTSSIDVPTNLWDRFKAALIAWIISYQIAFLVVENNCFRDLIRIAHVGLAEMIPTGNTIRKWILDLYETKKAILKAKLHDEAIGQIHISFDLWTSLNGLALMAVVAHFTDKDYRVQTRLLALRRLYGEHSGENQAELLADVLKDYELTDKIGYFVTDNALNNNTAVDILLRDIQPFLSQQ